MRKKIYTERESQNTPIDTYQEFIAKMIGLGDLNHIIKVII